MRHLIPQDSDAYEDVILDADETLVDFEHPQTGRAKTRDLPKVQIEVLIHPCEESNYYRIQLDESAPIQTISRWGVRFHKRTETTAIIEMTEERALKLDLL